VSYRNKTYVCFDADTDIRYYRMMCAWKENDNIDFNFHNAHDLNNLRDYASEEQIKKKLRERLSNTKQMIVLVGENTRNLYKYVRWEIEIAISLGIPIIAVNLDGENGSTHKTPPILKKNAYFVSVPFKMKAIRHALDNFPSEFAKSDKKPSARVYSDPAVVALWNK